MKYKTKVTHQNNSNNSFIYIEQDSRGYAWCSVFIVQCVCVCVCIFVKWYTPVLILVLFECMWLHCPDHVREKKVNVQTVFWSRSGSGETNIPLE